ncbi:disease resistance protein At4g27190-like [Ziziphus jujuba]|uniref:Disease resistance protein At4g27190-like n=1 Tax=Ziziphus jujuba TaxID=326968 RepID=A0ABM4AFR8_ZIZJJ|nr:disease resistance protein At4g27190-like [Ziziphus jujuba]
MSCIAEIGIAAIADWTVGAIGRQLGYIFQYKNNISNLQTETHNLGLEEQKMKELVDDALTNGDAIFETTKNWQKDAEMISKQAKEILEDENRANTGWCIFRGLLLLNLVPRYRLSTKAKKMGVSVVKIKGEVNFENISHRPHLQSDFMNEDYINFDSRNEIVDGILEALEDGNTRMIGVHGMPGAGKTTLVKEVSRRALEMKLFSEAVLVPVSNTPDIGKIQKAIAERLELKLDKETTPERALLLRNKLQQEKKFLIILDDVWKKLNIRDVGTVFKGDQIGCKILFTSRFERVLPTDIGVDKIFKVGLLEKAEALNWFSSMVAQTIEKYSECADLVHDIADECGRLPITVETIACALKDQRRHFWQDVLNQLKNSNLRDINREVNEKVFNSIELCYNYVYNNEAKLLLLVCSSFGEDESIRIEELIRYGMGWGIFEKMHNVQGARVKVNSLIDDLKDRALLLDGDDHHIVKMHDIIRDVAISVVVLRPL